MKQVLSTGQASAVDDANRLYESGDLAGAVRRLKEALDTRKERGKALAVIREQYHAYSEELHQKNLREYRATLSNTSFDMANYKVIEGVLSSIDRSLRDGIYSGKSRPEAEELYKQHQGRFQELQVKVHEERQGEIIGRLRGMDPAGDADEFVTLVEELRSLGGRFPEEMQAAYRVAQERSYIVPDNLQEFDNYVIERRLGCGGFASVFLVSAKGLAFPAVIKVFSPQPSLVRESGLSLAELKERFRREAGIMLRLSTERVPGVVNARDTRTWQGKPYLTMDYYPKNLSSLIGSDDELLQTGRGGYLTYDRAFPLIRDILSSISGLHNRTEPIIHRDLKPANILLDKDNRPYIGDFGLAREASRTDLFSKAFQTVTGTHLATQYYGGPEQRGGFKETDQRADVFSLGVMIYRIFTGRLIGFHDLEPIERYVQVFGKDTADRINDLLNKATRIEVDQRLADVSTLLEAFSTDQATVEVSQAPPSGPTPEDQFLTALELAFSFAPDGKLPENVRATLLTKSRELGIDEGEAEILENDFRSRHGLSVERDDGVVSATVGTQLKSEADKGKGALIITSEPEMAEVFVDGLERGKTPLRIATIAAGMRSIRLKMPGFFPATRIVRIDPDKEEKVHVTLGLQIGSIKAEAKTFSKDCPARYYLDGRLMGEVPLTLENISAGVHSYRVEADGYQGATGELTVSLDDETRVTETLKPLPGKLIEAPGSVFTDPSTGMEFIYIPAGEFIMGDLFSHRFRKDGRDDEKPLHEVEINGFYIGRYPVTQGEWKKVMDDNPSKFKSGGNYPVENVSWNDAQKFMKRLTTMNNGKYLFRLPTEAEWEYAARAGTTTRFYFGNYEGQLRQYAWYSRNSGGKTHGVGQKQPNLWGLYDMHGNVWEWCQDWYGDYPSGSITDPTGPSSGSHRVLRGGSWIKRAGRCRSAQRGRCSPSVRNNSDIGFRLALSPIRTEPTINNFTEKVVAL